MATSLVEMTSAWFTLKKEWTLMAMDLQQLSLWLRKAVIGWEQSVSLLDGETQDMVIRMFLSLFHHLTVVMSSHCVQKLLHDTSQPELIPV